METLTTIDCEQHQKKLLEQETTRFVAYLLELFTKNEINKEQMNQCLYQEGLDDLT